MCPQRIDTHASSPDSYRTAASQAAGHRNRHTPNRRSSRRTRRRCTACPSSRRNSSHQPTDSTRTAPPYTSARSANPACTASAPPEHSCRCSCTSGSTGRRRRSTDSPNCTHNNHNCTPNTPQSPHGHSPDQESADNQVPYHKSNNRTPPHNTQANTTCHQACSTDTRTCSRPCNHQSCTHTGCNGCRACRRRNNNYPSCTQHNPSPAVDCSNRPAAHQTSKNR